MANALINGNYDWNYDNFETILHTGRAIFQKFMTLSEKVINFKEESQISEIFITFKELENAIQNFIFKYVSINLSFSDKQVIIQIHLFQQENE